jgi:hypothetical protein
MDLFHTETRKRLGAMSLEFWTTATSTGTFVVIAATAAAALIQLRHMRGNNQIAAAIAINQVIESSEFQTARRFVRESLVERLRDIDYRRELAGSGKVGPEMALVGNYYELIGIFVKYGLIDESLACEMWSNEIVMDWKRMAPAIAILNRGKIFGWANFEYICSAAVNGGRFAFLRAISQRIGIEYCPTTYGLQ